MLSERLQSLSNSEFTNELDINPLRDAYKLDLQESNIKIASLNMQMFSNLAALMSGSPSPSSKIEMLREFVIDSGIYDADVIFFQEAFSPTHRNELRTIMAEFSFDESTSVPFTGDSERTGIHTSAGVGGEIAKFFGGLGTAMIDLFEGRGASKTQFIRGVHTEDGGAFMVTKHPILAHRARAFETQASGSDAFSDKGYSAALININGRNFHFITTHLQSEDDNVIGSAHAITANSDIRKKQLLEIKQFIDEIKLNSPGESIILGGDLNMDARSEEFASLFADEQPLEGFVGGKYLEGSEEASYPGEDTILDHILLDPNLQYMNIDPGLIGVRLPQIYNKGLVNKFDLRILSNNLDDGREFTDHRPFNADISFIYSPTNWQMVKLANGQNYTQQFFSADNVLLFSNYGDAGATSSANIMNSDVQMIEFTRGDNIAYLETGKYNINGGFGSEKFITNGGVISIIARDGDDWIQGGSKSDASGDNYIFARGGRGDDTFLSGEGRNNFIGGPGADEFVMLSGSNIALGGTVRYQRDNKQDTFWLAADNNGNRNIINYFENSIDKIKIIDNSDQGLSLDDIKYENKVITDHNAAIVYRFPSVIKQNGGLKEESRIKQLDVEENVVTLYYIDQYGNRQDIVEITGMHETMFFPDDIEILSSEAARPERLPGIFTGEQNEITPYDLSNDRGSRAVQEPIVPPDQTFARAKESHWEDEFGL